MVTVSVGWSTPAGADVIHDVVEENLRTSRVVFLLWWLFVCLLFTGGCVINSLLQSQVSVTQSAFTLHETESLGVGGVGEGPRLSILPRFLFGKGDEDQIKGDGCPLFLCLPKELSDVKSQRPTQFPLPSQV